MTNSTPSKSDFDNLDDNWRDRLLAATKGAVGLVPMAGGPLAEIVGSVVPGQRIDRIVTYLRALSVKMEELDAKTQEELKAQTEKIDLIEEGGHQAARATSPERIDMIVEAVSRGLSADEADIVRRKRLLLILGEIDQDEMIFLNAYGRSYGGIDRRAFDSIERPLPLRMSSSEEERDRHELFQTGEAHLLRLGLLRKNYRTAKKGEMPEFDTRTGDFKHRVEISQLGRMLLREIGMPTPFDQQNS